MKKIIGTLVIGAICAGFGVSAQAVTKAQQSKAHDGGQYVGCSVLVALVSSMDGLTFQAKKELETQARVMSMEGLRIFLELPITEEQALGLHEDTRQHALNKLIPAWENGEINNRVAMNCDALYMEIR